MSIKKYFEVFRKDAIARRYFVMNSFDGCLTVMGIVMAFFIAGSQDPSNVIVSTVGAAVAMGVSGLWGAYAIEKAERMRSIADLEKHMMRSLKESKLRKKVDELSIVLAVIDGLSPAIVSLIAILPFVLLPIQQAYIVSFGIIACTLFLLGIFVGRVAKENVVVGGIKMLIAGLVVGMIVLGLEFINII
jgi:predicted membrane protein (TIGR00267 family)